MNGIPASIRPTAPNPNETLFAYHAGQQAIIPNPALTGGQMVVFRVAMLRKPWTQTAGETIVEHAGWKCDEAYLAAELPRFDVPAIQAGSKEAIAQAAAEAQQRSILDRAVRNGGRRR